MTPQSDSVPKVTRLYVEEPGDNEKRASYFGIELPGLKDSQATVTSCEGSILSHSFLNFNYF